MKPRSAAVVLSDSRGGNKSSAHSWRCVSPHDRRILPIAARSAAPSRPAASPPSSDAPALRSSLRLSISSNASAASRTATCSGITSAPQPSSSTCRSAISERMAPNAPCERRADREHAVLVSGERRLAPFAHARHPVERVLEQRRHRRVVFRAGDEDALVLAEQPLELDRIVRRPVERLQVAVVERQRKVGERDVA